MKLLVISVLAVTAVAAPQGYSLTEPRGAGLSGDRGHAAVGDAFAGVRGGEIESSLITDISAGSKPSESEADAGFPLTAGLATESESSVGVVETAVSGGQRLGTNTASRAAIEDHSNVGESSSTEVDVSEDFHSGLFVSEAGRAASTGTSADNTGDSPSGLYGTP
ncbi:hypothetical protein C7M84_023560 [Penaeus vannamei]|uniref:Uncharacterized protein n=1 Tax=Penaeus vannamei TaxID=6689 RepID=A0A3R7MQJ1_PENVA|nr:hypothetical protein C7M84_023560 [Penaeus vannamei]